MGKQFLRVITVCVFMVTSTAFAGPQYVINNLALGGYDPVAYFTSNKPVKGSARYSYTWNNAVWHFASSQNRRTFSRNPEKYAPAYDGHCAFGVAKNGKVPGDPLAWSIYNGRLYVNVNKRVQGWWEKDIPGFLERSESNWPALESRPSPSAPPPRLR